MLSHCIGWRIIFWNASTDESYWRFNSHYAELADHIALGATLASALNQSEIWIDLVSYF
jgi:hypothetical protein